MNVNEVLEVVQKVLLRQLSPIERLVLCQSWLGKNYSDMAQMSAYGIPYLKEIGSQLWNDLSERIGKKVTKKNIHLVLNQYQQNYTAQLITPLQQYSDLTVTEENNLPFLVQNTEIKFPGSPLLLNSSLYINRPPIEELACTEISQPGCVLRIKAPRKMGKSSLLNRVLAHATSLEYKTVYLDFQEADEAIFSELNKFLRWFSANVSQQLNLNPMLDQYWDEDMGSKVSCKIYFQAYILKQIENPLVLALNEVNRVFEHPHIAQEFFPMLRFWHEQARTAENWQKLRLIVVHTTEVYITLKLNQSPFNVGLSIRLPQFTTEQVQNLAERYGLNWHEGETQQLMEMVGGHPYLICIALYHLCCSNMTLQDLLENASTPAGIYNDHLRGHLAILRGETQLASALQQIINARESIELEAIVAYKLESMGLVQLDGNRATSSCKLYRLYFSKQLGEENQTDPFSTLLDSNKLSFPSSNNVNELTQLVNRCYFNQYLEVLCQKIVEKNSTLSLILCDIDYFRFYIQAYGYLAGESCLQQIAITIQNCVSQASANLVRYGNEEFAIVLPEINISDALKTAEKIRENVKALAIAHDQNKIGGFPASVLTVSLGVAEISSSPQTSVEQLLSIATQALLEAKRQGRDCVFLASNLEG
jgi:diguanylate cyclase (GGDEF)-like protein